VFIGPRGAGKTTVGRLAAARLGRPFVDTDGRVREESGKTLSTLFEEGGEDAFRGLEARVVAAAAATAGQVIAVGGGAVEDPENVRRLRATGLLCRLTAPAGVLLRRTARDPGSAESRPPLTDLDPRREMEAVLRRREALYEGASHFAVDTETASPEETAEKAVREFEARCARAETGESGL
jgi:shikimate kinase